MELDLNVVTLLKCFCSKGHFKCSNVKILGYSHTQSSFPFQVISNMWYTGQNVFALLPNPGAYGKYCVLSSVFKCQYFVP